MSKVKLDEYVGPHVKEKLKHNLRRKEEKAIKNKRINEIKNNGYRYWSGYYLKDEVRIGHYKEVNIPEQIIKQTIIAKTVGLTVTDYDPVTNEKKEKTIYIPVYENIEKVIPAHTKRQLTEIEYKALKKPYLKKSENSLAFHKKVSNKRVRKARNLDNGSYYKKVYDMRYWF